MVLLLCVLRLSGISPFHADSIHDTLKNVKTGYFDFENQAFSHISTEAKDFISKLLNKDVK